MREIYLCAICNIKSGNCSEDCKFCTQSAHYKSDIEPYSFKETSQILDELKRAINSYAVGFCLVSSGKSLDDSECEKICFIAKEIKKAHEINLIACNGIATFEQLKELKRAGIDSYNHNLETSLEFYPNICTTHEWQSRYECCLDVKRAGLKLCSGGIFGLGESSEDRKSFISSLKELKPNTIALNFYHPNPALPLKNEVLKEDEAFFWLRCSKKELGFAKIMVAGGREIVFKNQERLLKSGLVDSIVIGDYLTTKGNEKSKDLELIKKCNINIAKNC